VGPQQEGTVVADEAARERHEYMLAWASLVHAGTFLAAALDRHLSEELGLSLVEQDLLSQVDKSGGRLRMVDLSRLTFLSKAGITKMVDRLESDGHVARRPSREDRRVINAELTDEGRDVLGRSRQLLRAWVKANFAEHLSPEETREFGAALRKLLEGHGRWEGQMAHLRGYREGPGPCET
jgi:DNA-binding MarR family transcriptional regulator